MTKTEHTKPLLILLVLSYCFFMLGNGILSLTNPDEVFYSQTAKEMAQQKTWMVPYLFGYPQFEKPILTYWLLRAAYIVFGVSSFGARFFPAFFALLGVLAVYALGFLGFNDQKKAFASGLILMTGGLYIGMARTVFTDMIFSVFILLSLLSFYWGYARRPKKGVGMLLFFAFAGLAVLAKGPLGLIVPALAVLLFLWIKRDIKFLFCASTWVSFLIFLLISVPWYAAMIRQFGDVFIQEFFYNDHIRRLIQAEHLGNDTWYFYLLATVGGMFPWSLYLCAGFVTLAKKLKTQNCPDFYLFLASWVLIVFVLFQSAHSKLASYVLPAFPALALITGDFIGTAASAPRRRLTFNLSFFSWLTLVSVPIGLLVSTVRFAHYLPRKGSIYEFIVFYAGVLAVMLYVLLKRNFQRYLFILALQAPLLLAFVLVSHKDFDDFISSKQACAHLMNNNAVDTKILCSKFLVRGVRFFTDKDVAVIRVAGSNFFSPHPIPFLDTDEKVRQFLESQKVTYGILDKRSYKDVRRITATGFKLEELKIIGDEYVVKVQKMNN